MVPLEDLVELLEDIRCGGPLRRAADLVEHPDYRNVGLFNQINGICNKVLFPSHAAETSP